ncbi:MAG: signal recognition particle-docking protein FtsY [Spirochaetaceae bacterium]|jgi:fused signal recognition particle receptor|nr:signal recognition particle-docking protein FtsY [Spirochaetaceae bacterium]
MDGKGFAGRLRDFFGFHKPLNEEWYEDLADLLVEGDFGAAGAFKAVDKLRDRCSRMKIADAEGCRRVLAEILEEELLRVRTSGQEVLEALFGPGPGGDLLGGPGDRNTGDPAVLLLLGVNGVGKTTTAAKLAHRFLSLKRGTPLLAAADTFRAAAIDQLKIHGERIGVRVIAHRHGGDPAAVVYDAVEAAQAGAADMIIADTAGRMHTKTALVEELKKIDRVVESKAAGARYLKLLVLDATTGRNALAQAEIFHGAVTLDAVILTKYDSGAKGGVVYSLAEELALPVIFLCDGEAYGDIRLFDPRGYTRQFIAPASVPGAGEDAD